MTARVVPMRTLVHLSDLHFGRAEPRLEQPLIETVRALRPDVLAVSGDLTQRARTRQFRAARRFLDALPRPQIVVPGNHDIPLHNPLARLFMPLRKFRRYVSDDLEPFFGDDEIAVLGLNTARSLTFKNGRVNLDQMAVIRRRFQNLGTVPVKVLVTHHPFDAPANRGEDLVGRARLAMATLAACRVDLLLAGHSHRSHAGHSGLRYRIAGYSALVVGAGTALSDRRRDEANAFNLLRIDSAAIALQRFAWDQGLGEFRGAKPERFRRENDGWRRMPADLG